LNILFEHPWHGNVRELENVIEYAVVRTKTGNNIHERNLPSSIKSSVDVKSKKVIKEFKRENPSELVQLLEKHHWNKSKVAKELGIGRTTLWRMLKNLPNEN